MDLVTPIADIFVCHASHNKDALINMYLTEALSGYQLERKLSATDQAQTPLFLSLLEIGLYTRFYKLNNWRDENGWVKTSMMGRKERIEAGIPFVNIA